MIQAIDRRGLAALVAAFALAGAGCSSSDDSGSTTTTTGNDGGAKGGSDASSSTGGGSSTGNDASSTATSDSGGGGGAALDLNGCPSSKDGYRDHTPDADARELTWTTAIGSSPDRCMRIKVGQKVTWKGSLSSHPLHAAGGTTPTPIVDTSSGSEFAATFATPGLYGYVCGVHPSMTGAILVE